MHVIFHVTDGHISQRRCGAMSGLGKFVCSQSGVSPRPTTPVVANESETLELLTHNAAARDAVAHAHKVAHLTRGLRASAGS